MKINIYTPNFSGYPQDRDTSSMDINVNNVLYVTEDKEHSFITYAEVKLVRGTYLVTKESADRIREAIA